MRPWHPKTLHTFRTFAESTMVDDDGSYNTCNIYNRVLVDTNFGKKDSFVASTALTGLRCRLQPLRAEDVKELDISADKLAWWLYTQALDKNGNPVTIASRAVVDVYDEGTKFIGRFEVEQFMGVSNQDRIETRILVTQRQDNTVPTYAVGGATPPIEIIDDDPGGGPSGGA